MFMELGSSSSDVISWIDGAFFKDSRSSRSKAVSFIHEGGGNFWFTLGVDVEKDVDGIGIADDGFKGFHGG